MNAEILSVGTELLLGGTVNTDARDISLALAELGVEASAAAYVGDSEVDVALARNAKLPLVAVSWGFRGRGALEEAGAVLVVDDAATLLENML